MKNLEGRVCLGLNGAEQLRDRKDRCEGCVVEVVDEPGSCRRQRNRGTLAR